MCQHYRSRDDTEAQRLDRLRSGRYIRRQHHDKEFPSKDEIIGLASIDVPPTDPLE